MDGVSGLEEGAKVIFKDVTVQRCMVHLIRNSIKYVPSKDYKKYTAQLKQVYEAPSLKAVESEFEKFKQAWSQYPGALDVWIRSWEHVAQLFTYGSAIRKVMYTTNAIESVNSSFRKVTKKEHFTMKMRCLNYSIYESQNCIRDGTLVRFPIGQWSVISYQRMNSCRSE